MMTTWQKMLAIFIGIVFGIIVGYICIKPHLNANSDDTQDVNTNDVFEQYLNNNNSISTETNTVETNSEIEKAKNNNTVEE